MDRTGRRECVRACINEQIYLSVLLHSCVLVPLGTIRTCYLITVDVKQ